MANEPIWVILVDDKISKDGFFTEAELDQAKNVMLKYKDSYKTELKKIFPFGSDSTSC